MSKVHPNAPSSYPPKANAPLYNAEAERAALAIVLLNNKLINDVYIEVGDFYLEKHQKWYSIMTKLVEDGEPVDLVTMSYKLTDDETVELNSYTSNGYMESSFPNYVSIIKDLSNKRKLQKLLLSLAREIPVTSVTECLEKLHNTIKNIDPSRREKRGVLDELRAWVAVTSGYWAVTKPYSELQAVTKQEKSAIRVGIHRLLSEGIIERVGTQEGVYRKVEKTCEVMDYLNTPDKEFPLIMPLGIHNLCKLYPSNIVIVAGSKSSGKTAFLLNIVKENMGINGLKAQDILYLNSEMGPSELRMRLDLFNVDIKCWKFTPISRMNNWADLITPEKKIFIIDFMEITDNFWRIAAEIQAIHSKLRDGIAIIAIQKEMGRDLARGGSFSQEKARLYLALDQGRIKIVDAKAWRDHGINPRGKIKDYKLVNGSEYKSESSWKEEVSNAGQGQQVQQNRFGGPVD